LVENTAGVVVVVAQPLHSVRGKIFISFDVHRYFLGG
jgi:hypothetical protein